MGPLASELPLVHTTASGQCGHKVQGPDAAYRQFRQGKSSVTVFFKNFRQHLDLVAEFQAASGPASGYCGRCKNCAEGLGALWKAKLAECKKGWKDKHSFSSDAQDHDYHDNDDDDEVVCISDDEAS